MEKFDLENFPTSESAKKMLGYVSDGFYDTSYVGKWIYQVMGLEYDKALEMVEELPEQFFPETATWGLKYHEIKWGLPVRENLSYEERRKLIYQKRDWRAPITPYRMEQMIQNQIGMAAEVSDANDPGQFGYVPEHPNVFQVCVRENGNSDLDYDRIEELIRKIMQSHTMFSVLHRQEYEKDIEIYVGTAMSEYTEYEVGLGQANRDMDYSANIYVSAVLDYMVIEEIGISERSGQLNDG